MRNILLAAGASLALGAGGAHASTISDPVGDFLPSFVAAFPTQLTPDLDVVGLTVDVNDATSAFDITGTLAGPLDTVHGQNLYVVGVDTGAGAIRPFADIGEPNVIFDAAIVIRENGTGFLGAHTLSPSIVGDSFSLSVPFAFLTSSGFASPHDYLFNLWPRVALGNNNQISDFAPQNALLAVPEPSVWALAILGLGLAGAAVRGRRSVRAA